MRTAHIRRFAELPEVDWGRGVSAKILVSAEIGSTNVTTGTTHFAPGAALPLHTHNCDEVVSVIEGEALAEVDGRAYELKPHDTTFVPEGIPHRFVNRGSGRMSILWSYPSGHVTRTIVDTGQTIDDLTPPN